MSPAVVTSGTPWNPGRIPNLAWDYDPSRLGLANGANVASLTDFGPGGRHAVQATAARQPTIVYDSLNGMAGVRFVAASAQYLLTAAFAESISQPVTMFLVGKANGNNQYFCDGLVAGQRMAIIRTSAAKWGLVTQGVELSGEPNDGEYAIITAVFNGAASLVRVNGVETTGTVGADILTGLAIGTNRLLTLHLDGVLVRHFGYNRLLTATEIARVERYLRDLTAIDLGWEVLFPRARHTYQSRGATTDLLIEGIWQLFEAQPSGFEARYNGGSWTDINATVNADGTWSGTLAGQSAAQGTLEVRRTDTPADTRSVALVGIGDVFLVAGQSNAVGHFDNDQAYSHATLSASLWRQNSSVPDNLTDPTDSDVSHGSAWPPLATHIMADQGVPVQFITTARGNSGLVVAEGGGFAEWYPIGVVGTAFHECIAVAARARHTRLKAILWYQGETDAAEGVTAAQYKAALSQLLDSLQTDLRLDLNDDPVGEDAFTAANGTTLNGRTPDIGPANWVVRSGSLEIQSNRVVRVGTATPSHIATVGTGEPNVRVTVGINQIVTAASIVLRYNPADSSHYLCVFRANSDRMDLYFTANGTTYTALGTGRGNTDIDPGDDVEIEAAANGSVITMRFGSIFYRWPTATENPTMTHHGFSIPSGENGGVNDISIRTIVATPLICTQIGEVQTESAGIDAVRTAQAELPAEDSDIFAGPLAHDADCADGVHWSTDAQAVVLAGRWWRAVDDALYGGTNGTGPTFVSATEVDSTHIDVVFSFPGSATSLVLGASPTVGWEVMDGATERTVSAVALQSATTLRLTLSSAITGSATISFGHGNESAGTTLADNHAYPLPPLPFLNKAVA